MPQFNRGSMIAANLMNNQKPIVSQGLDLAGMLDTYKDTAQFKQQYDEAERKRESDLATQGFMNDYRNSIDAGDEQGAMQAASKINPYKTYEIAQNIKAREAEQLTANSFRNRQLGLMEDEAMRKMQKDQRGEALRLQSIDAARSGTQGLEGVANRGSIGSLTRLRSAFNMAEPGQNQELGRLSSSISAIAPLAIQRLKDAGVSGVNTMAEFMTYVGLPENANSEQIKGALPGIKTTLGLDDGGVSIQGGKAF